MKKVPIIFTFIMILFLITGCGKKTFQIKMVMEKENNQYVFMNYPETGIKKLDQKIENYVDEKYEDFKKLRDPKNINEFNIDYEYQKLDNHYISGALKMYQNLNEGRILNHTMGFVFDKKKNEFLTLGKFLNDNPIETLIKSELLEKYKNELDLYQVIELTNIDFSSYQNFQIGEKEMTIFFNYGEESYQVEIDYQQVGIREMESDVVQSEKVDLPVSDVIDPNKKVIALTFDDGPSIYTDEILNVLKDNDAVATFFVLGNKVDLYKREIQKAVINGNEIGNHSYNHKWLSRLSISELMYQINTTNEKIKNITGVSPTFLRPTYGEVNSRIRNHTDMKIVLWNIDPKDWKRKSPNKISDDVLKYAEDGKIVLLHDTHKRTLETLRILLPKLKKECFQFVTLSELEEVRLLRNLKMSFEIISG